MALRPWGRVVRSKAFLASKLSYSLCIASSHTELSGLLTASWYEFGGLLRSQERFRRKGRGAERKQSLRRDVCVVEGSGVVGGVISWIVFREMHRLMGSMSL